MGLGNLRRIRLHRDDRSVRELSGEVVIGLQILDATPQLGTNQLITEIGDSRLFVGVVDDIATPLRDSVGIFSWYVRTTQKAFERRGGEVYNWIGPDTYGIY